IMAEAKSRKENAARTRTRAKPEYPSNNGEEDLRDTEAPLVANEDIGEEATTSRQEKAEGEKERIGAFDEEINNRYEEIKRGSTHISEIQQMTMPQLLKVAKEEGLSDYTGLKKQDLIFKILKERVKQNGLMFGEGTLEVLPDGFGFLRSPDYNYLPCPDDIYI